jgi:glyoxylase-like metal-dependent hydrolase (beta-lactamase superfamily II)/rhodanese-related sulfurtransferase
MIFRQLFDSTSCTYTYLLASRKGGEALIIDPVLDRVDHYLRLLDELDLKLVKAVDTHLHADHVTALGALRDRTRCITIMGAESSVDVVSVRVAEGDSIAIEGLALEVMYTPGHTDDSYSFSMADRVFTGDTLFIRGTGRTDFQHGDARAQYHSIFDKLLKLPDETLVYPGHDYKGDTVSTIAEERDHNPRLQVSSVEEYVDIMNNLNLADPKMMDVAVPANQAIGADQKAEVPGLSVDEVAASLEQPDVLLVDLREDSERASNGFIPGSIQAVYGNLGRHLKPGGMLHYEATKAGKRVIYYCAFGERSALAVQASQEQGIDGCSHLAGGLDAWAKAGGPLER